MERPISKYDRILNKFRESDFTDKEVKEIRDFFNHGLAELPRVKKLTYPEFIALEEKSEYTKYYITTDDGRKIIATFLGDTPIVANPGALYDLGNFGEVVYQ